MSRLSLRLRLTLAFAVVMAAMLVAVGALLYVRLGDDLEEQLDQSLTARGQALQALVGERGAGVNGGALGSAADDDEAFGQVLAANGSVVASSPGLSDRRLLAEGELAAASSRSLLVSTDAGRVLALPVESRDGTLVLVVGSSYEERDEALDSLLAQLLVVGPLALLASSLAGYFLAAAALRPVEAMRRRAGEITSERTGQRLPLPRAHDEIHRLGRTLNEMLGRLEAGLERERRFVADASHELRTPLSLLETELELALRRPRSAEELRAALASAAEETDRLVLLADDLLTLAGVDEGGLRLSSEPIRVRDLLESVARRFAARADEADRALEVDAPADLAVVGDRLRLEQALGNLADNALRHGAGTVRLEARRELDAVVLRVRDDGPGFRDEFLPSAFERFSSADGAHARGGTGLGLALVAAIARAHGGTVSAANRAAGGADVALSLRARRTHRRLIGGL